MSVELRQLKDAVTGQPFVPVTHWDAVSNKPNIDGSLNSINASLNAIDASVKTLDSSVKSLDSSVKSLDASVNTLDASIKSLDASIKNIDIPIKSITGEAGLAEYANSEFVAVSISEPDENGNVSIDASVKVVTLADASEGMNGLASALDIYTELIDIELTAAEHLTAIADNVGLESDYTVAWDPITGIDASTIKEAIEYVSMNAGVKINDSSIDSSTVWSSQKISDELNNIDIVQINDSSIDASLVWSSKKVDNELYDVLPENKKYLTFEAIEDGSIGWYNNSNNEIQATVQYSFDKIEWNDFEQNGENPVYVSVPAGSKLYCRGINPNGVEGDAAYYNDSPNGFVQNTGQWNVSGNIMSIIDYENLDQMITMIGNFYYLFSNDEGFKAGSTLDIVNANNLILPATILTIGCYSGMFQGCSSLTSVPVLHATTLAERCYGYMFQGCSSLTSAPELPATTLANQCYFCMFYGCSSLTSAPELPATTLATSCYYEMFQGCSSLTSAPELPATTLANQCYFCMFKSCSNLNYIKCLATTGIDENSSTTNWVTGVASSGTFIKNPNTTWPTGNNGIPTGWSCPEECLKFTSTENSTISLSNSGGNTPDIKYSLNNGGTWTQWDYSSISLSNGQSVIMKGNNPNGFSSSSSKYSKFVMTGSLAANGNIMSLVDDGLCQTLTIPNYCYYQMFYNCSSLTSSPELPATILTDYCYYQMFYNCSSLTSAPELPATTLTNSCYSYMFTGCSSLTSAPELSATTLASYCYFDMFSSCSGLTNAPELPATILADHCYHYMFYGCSSLTSAPALPATTLADNCYSYMFNGCSGLTNAPALPATTLANNCYLGMFQNCSRLTSAPALPATTLANSCYSNMFNGCSSLTSAPALPTTTLADNCYRQMFRGCSSLTSAPELPATTLVERCYYGMFQNCSNLNYIKCLATSGINTNDSTINWVTGLASAGTFVKDPNATWPIGNNGIPTGWNVINLSSEQIYENGHIYNSSVNSIAEGVINGSINNTIVEQSYATGINSHVEGIGTQAQNTAEHAEGKYNQSHENQTIHSIGIGTSNEDRKNAFEVTQDGSIYVYGLGNYDGTNPANAETLQNSLADLIPITYDDLLQKVNSKLLIPGKKYLITDYITKINNSAFTSLEKKYDGIVCEAISNFELSRVNCTAILSYEGSRPNEDVYIWIDNFPESIIENEPDILQNYHDNFREYFEGSKLHRLGQIEFESESYWLWEYVTNNGFGSDKWIPNVQYALTLESDFEGNTLLDDVTNINRPILYYLGSDKSQIDYGNDGTKHDEYAWVVVKQEKYTYDPATITSNTIYVEKFSYDPLSNDIDQSYYEETNFYEEGAGSTNEYKLRGTLEWDDNEYYLWELTDGHAIDNDQTQYSWMLTKTADFRGLSLQDDYENNRYCPCFCFLNEDKSEAYLDENDNYQNHEILLIQAVYDPSLPEVEPLSGGGGETKVVEYEIGYDITKQFDGHKGTILYMQDEYGNSANFDFKNIKSKKYGFLFGGENDLTLNGTYKENKVLGELREFSICSETCYGSTFTQNCLGTIYQDLENCEVSYDNNQFVVFDPYHHETLNTILIEHQKNIEDIDTVTSSLLVNHEDRIRELEAKIEQLMNA